MTTKKNLKTVNLSLSFIVNSSPNDHDTGNCKSIIITLSSPLKKLNNMAKFTLKNPDFIKKLKGVFFRFTGILGVVIDLTRVRSHNINRICMDMLGHDIFVRVVEFSTNA